MSGEDIHQVKRQSKLMGQIKKWIYGFTYPCAIFDVGVNEEGCWNYNQIVSQTEEGKQGKLRNTKIREVGTYQKTLDVVDEQLMTFSDSDDGPFYLTPEE